MTDDNPPDPVLTPGEKLAILKAQIRREALFEAAAACLGIAHGSGLDGWRTGFSKGAAECSHLLHAMADAAPKESAPAQTPGHVGTGGTSH